MRTWGAPPGSIPGSSTTTGDGVSDVSLVSGPLPVVVLVVGGLALLVLLARRGRRQLVTVVVAVVLGAVVFLGLNWLVTTALARLPEPLPAVVRAWVAAVVLAVGNLAGTSAGRKVTALASGLVVLVATGSQINGYFAEYPTLGALTDSADAGVSPLTGAVRRPSLAEPTPAVDRWTGPPAGPARS